MCKSRNERGYGLKMTLLTVYHIAAPGKGKQVERGAKAGVVMLCTALACGIGWFWLNEGDNRYRLPRPAAAPAGYRVSPEQPGRDGLVFLCDGWAFYPEVRLEPADFLPGGRAEREVQRPAAALQGERPAGRRGTYRLTLRAGEQPAAYMLEIPGPFEGEIWVNGAARSPDSLCGAEGRAVYFEAAGEIEIVAFAAAAGPAGAQAAAPPALGAPAAVHRYLSARLLICVFAGSLAGLLGIVVPAVSIRVRAPELGLAFLLFCAGCMVSVGSGPLLGLWPASRAVSLACRLAPYAVFFALEWISGVLCGLCDDLPKWVTYSGLLPFGLAALEEFELPAWLLSACEKGLEAYVFLACGYLVGAAAFSARRGRPFTLPLVAGFTCLGFTFAAQRLGGPYSAARLPDPFSLCSLLLLLIFTAVLCAHGVRAFHDGIESAEREKAVRRLLHDQKAYYAELMLRQKKTREFQHEVRHKLFLLQYYLQNGRWEKGQSVFQDLLEQTMPPKALSGNPLINAVLTDFSAVCAKREIEFEIRLSGLPALLPYEDEDLCCVLMNLLQNAVEACEKLPAGKKRSIQFSMEGGAAALRAQCSNTKANPVKKRGDRLLSDKPQAQEHGFGLALAQRAIKKYGGDMEIEYSAERFSVWAVLPLNGGEKAREQAVQQ